MKRTLKPFEPDLPETHIYQKGRYTGPHTYTIITLQACIPVNIIVAHKGLK